ncbi:MAG: polyphosphate polymerase domain-containing protein [Clostridia bacterium]|nr:polyphosphate polymerase domain-containing protein [Clostridia bacterium]
MLTRAQYAALMTLIERELTPDRYSKSTVGSLYLDTPDFRMIRSSIEASNYKEKLRVRTYGCVGEGDLAFLEIKKKCEGVVYKRREALPLSVIMRYLVDGILPCDTQIMREIDYAWRTWGCPMPAALIFYEREAYVVKNTPSVRLTFDRNVRYRTVDLDFTRGDHGTAVTGEDAVLMEIKTEGAMPLFLSHALDSCRIFPTSFSKYGTAYTMFFHTVFGVNENTREKGEIQYA